MLPPPPNANSTRPGHQTTEFWLLILLMVFTFILVLTNRVPSDFWGEFVIGQGIAVGAYSVSRGLAKK